MFCGEFIRNIEEENRVKLDFDLEGSECDIICVKGECGNVFMAIFPSGAGGSEEFFDAYEVLERKKASLKDEITLPEVFMCSMNGESEVEVLGVFDHIEIMRKGCSDFDMMSEEGKSELVSEISRLLEEAGV